MVDGVIFLSMAFTNKTIITEEEEKEGKKNLRKFFFPKTFSVVPLHTIRHMHARVDSRVLFFMLKRGGITSSKTEKEFDRGISFLIFLHGGTCAKLSIKKKKKASGSLRSLVPA